MLFGEDRLQRPPARQPGIVGEVEHVAAEDPAHLVVDRQSLVDESVRAT